MADTGTPDDGPSLEMPSFSMRRRKDQAPEDQPEDETPEEQAPETVGPRPRARRELPLTGLPAAAATGVLVGALALVLSWLATSACEVVRGTSSCGGGPGLVMLVVLALLAYAGGLVLRALGVPDAGSTSLLAVGTTAVLVMVFLLGSIDEWWMVIAIPVAAVIAFCAAWWVTNAVVGEETDASASPPYDVR